jgi:hypothetical protein
LPATDPRSEQSASHHKTCAGAFFFCALERGANDVAYKPEPDTPRSAELAAWKFYGGRGALAHP